MTVGTAARLLCIMALWAGCFPLISLALGLAPHLGLAALRASLAGACLLIVAAGCRRQIPSEGRAWALIAVSAIGGTSLGFLGMFHAAEFASPGVATVVANTQPVMAAILACALLGERVGRTGRAGLAIAFVGVGALAWPAGPTWNEAHATGIGFAILAAAGVAVGNIAMKRLAGRVDAVMTTGLQLSLGAVPLAILSLATEDLRQVDHSSEFITLLAAMAVLGTSLPAWLWFDLLDRVPLNQANAFTFLVPLIGLAIGAGMFGERLTLLQAIGGLFVVAGVALAQLHGSSDLKP